jgi:Copper binding periplasmic protein CusF
MTRFHLPAAAEAAAPHHFIGPGEGQYNGRMNRKLIAVATLFLAIAAGCTKRETAQPVSVKGEKVYELRGKITARDTEQNALTVDHETIPGFMEAMTMSYPVRGGKVEQLPAVGSKITARLHVIDDGYWISDVKAAP